LIFGENVGEKVGRTVGSVVGSMVGENVCKRNTKSIRTTVFCVAAMKLTSTHWVYRRKKGRSDGWLNGG
jgi:hypothetical protein